MHVLIGLLLGIALLYFWLVGHWFARVLMLLALAPLFAFIGCVLFVGIPGATPIAITIGGMIGAGLAWPVASLPTYHWRRRGRQFTAAAGYPPTTGFRVP
jgi:hypothetical protein